MERGTLVAGDSSSAMSPSPGTERTRSIAIAYLLAKRFVVSAGYEDELAWQESACLDGLESARFMREATWVILNSGMSERVVRQKYPFVLAAFERFESTTDIAADPRRYIEAAAQHFGHWAKLRAITEVCRRVADLSSARLRDMLSDDPITFLMELPYIGPVTAFHLAKNLGLDVAKPDRHLVRLAADTGYDSAEQLCSAIAAVTGDRVAVVDLVLWRFTSIQKSHRALWVAHSEALEHPPRCPLCLAAPAATSA
jgi:hypothetical protein